MTDSQEKSAPSGLPNHITNGAIRPNSKRPKLSLQTTSLANTYGVLTRGLAPQSDAQATFTPTTTNTLANTWDLSIRPSPVSRTESPRHPPTRTQTPQQPYTLSLPFGIKSILKNSPLPPKQSSISASPRDPKRKIFFPQSKRVVFKRNLEDFVETTHYVARHSDLASSSSEDSSDEEGQGDASTVSVPEIGGSGTQVSPPPSRKRKNRRGIGIQIETNMEDKQKQSEESASATTPSNVRKRRRWSWNLASRGADKSGAQNNAPIEAEADSDQGENDVNEGDTSPQPPFEAAAESDQTYSASSADSHGARVSPEADRDGLDKLDAESRSAKTAARSALEPS